MNKRSFALFLCLASSICTYPGFSQETPTCTLYSIVVGSEGVTSGSRKKILAQDAEKHLDRMCALLLQVFGVPNSRAEIFPLARPSSTPVLQRIAESCSLIDPTCLFVGAVFGAWQIDTARPDRSFLLADSTGAITADYCVNLVDLMDARAGVFFIVTTEQFPTAVLGVPTDHFEPEGKFIIVMHSSREMDYGEMLDQFESALLNVHETWKVDNAACDRVSFFTVVSRVVKSLEARGVSLSIHSIALTHNSQDATPRGSRP